MTANQKFTLILISIIIPIQLYARSPQKHTITGQILDAHTQKPIPHAEVFVSGTTSGCISDSLGNFTLKVPYFPCTLVADHVAYESFIKPLSDAKHLQIILTPSNFSLREVSISGKNKRKKNLRFFYSHFIPENRSKIKILNDSILVFERDKMSFTASTNEQLIVENSVLGYRIKVVLEEFEVIAVDGPNGKQIPLNSMEGGEVMTITGYYFYEPLEEEFSEFEDYYKQNRSTIYFGSYRHFLKSIYDEEPEQQGYEIEVIPEDEKAAFYRIPSTKAVNNAKEYIILAEELKINYHFDDDNFPIAKEEIGGRFTFSLRESVIYPTKKPFIIRENGTSPKLTFVIDGLMVTKSFANSLPEDYVPPLK